MPLFAARFPDETAGMVLVDPVVPAEWNPPSQHDRKLTRIGAEVCRRAALLSRFGLTRFIAFLLTTRAAKIAALPTNPEPFRVHGLRLCRQTKKAMASVFWVQEKFALTIASQLGNLPLSAAQMAERHSVCDEQC